MDERLFFDSMASMRLDFASGFPYPLSGATPKSELPLERQLL
jgi:hypothetical protein